jgi:hypothetical protein
LKFLLSLSIINLKREIMISIDAFDRMLGLTPISAQEKLEQAIKAIAEDLVNVEGFEPEDVVDFIERVAYFVVSDVVEGEM